MPKKSQASKAKSTATRASPTNDELAASPSRRKRGSQVDLEAENQDVAPSTKRRSTRATASSASATPVDPFQKLLIQSASTSTGGVDQEGIVLAETNGKSRPAKPLSEREELERILNLNRKGGNPELVQHKEEKQTEERITSEPGQAAHNAEELQLIDDFRAVDTCLLVLEGRRLGKSLVEWKEVKKSVEATTRRNFSLESFSKLLFIYPDAYHVSIAQSKSGKYGLNRVEGTTNEENKISPYNAETATFSWKRLAWMEEDIVVRVGDAISESYNHKEASSVGEKIDLGSDAAAPSTVHSSTKKKASFKERQLIFKRLLEAKLEEEKSKRKSPAEKNIEPPASNDANLALIAPFEEPFKKMFEIRRSSGEAAANGPELGSISTQPTTSSSAPGNLSAPAKRSMHPIDALLLGKNHHLHQKAPVNGKTIHSL